MQNSLLMCPDIEVKFVRLSRDPSVEAAIQRWVDRLDWSVEIGMAQVVVERAGWRRVTVHATLVLGNGKELTFSTSHTDIYVAVADAFRGARKRLLGGVLAPAAEPRAARALALSV